MAAERRGFWRGLKDDVTEATHKSSERAAERVANGPVDKVTSLTIYTDGTFTTKVVFGKESERDQLLGFDHDADSIRRKSATGRGTAAMMTGGASLLAANNRGVVYATVTGEITGIQTFTTRNPDGSLLTGLRRLKAATDMVLAQRDAAPEPSSATGVAEQIEKLAALHAAGALSDEEFAAAKARLLG